MKLECFSGLLRQCLHNSLLTKGLRREHVVVSFAQHYLSTMMSQLGRDVLSS